MEKQLLEGCDVDDWVKKAQIDDDEFEESAHKRRRESLDPFDSPSKNQDSSRPSNDIFFNNKKEVAPPQIGLTGDDDVVDDEMSNSGNEDWMFQTFLKNKRAQKM